MTKVISLLTIKVCIVNLMILDYLQHLSFTEMDDRFNDITKPSSTTCTWLLEHEIYSLWLTKTPNLLRIKGKPGSGKSILMRFAVEAKSCARSTSKKPIVARYFFHARGTESQKTSSGMYRSLLHQILLQTPSLRPDFRRFFREKTRTRQTCNWHINELQQLLTDNIKQAIQDNPVFIYIDALDECDSKEEKALTNYLQNLTMQTSVKICFSCRHYPNIRLSTKFSEICVEAENMKDIARYIETTFENSCWNDVQGFNLINVQEIKKDILNRSSEIFLWVYLIFMIIDKLIRKSTPWRVIQKKIREVPQGLTELYTYILASLDEEDLSETRILMRWIRFVKEPLTSNELRVAMAFDTNENYSSLKSWRESDEYYENDSQWKERITYLSGGLAEIVARDRYQGSGSNGLVQFIHESVNNYLQKEGISLLNTKQAGSIIGQCHNQIARSCIYFLKCQENRTESKMIDRQTATRAASVRSRLGYHKHTLEDDDDDDNKNEDWNIAEDKKGSGNENQTESDDQEFVKYACDWTWHSEQAENENCAQEHILTWFDFPSLTFFEDWLVMCKLESPVFSRVSQRSDISFKPGSTFLHIAASANLFSLIKMLLTKYNVNIDAKDYNGKTALMHASRNGRIDIVELLLERKANINIKAKQSQHGDALTAASGSGHEAIVELLLNRGADVNAFIGHDSALGQASAAGHETVVKLLLK